jgi:site-specific recombinase XerC
MSVHKRTLPSGRTQWEVRWRETDRNRSRSFDTKQDAGDFDKTLRRLRQQGELAAELTRRRVTISDLAAEWWDRAAGGLSAKTVENYATQLDLRVLEHLGDRRAAQLTVGDVERWIDQMRRDGCGDPTILKACTVLQSLLSMAVRDGVITVNVAQQARKPRQGRDRVPYLIRPDAVERIRRVLEEQGRERDIVLLELLAYAGLRPESEAITLRWRQVRDRSLLIRDTKRGRERTVVLLEPLRDTLNQWRLRRGRPGPDALVVPTAVEGPWTDTDWRNWRRRVFDPAAVATDLHARPVKRRRRDGTLADAYTSDVRPRDLRGSFVSLLVHEGRNIVEVAAQVGHSPVICLRDYAQVFSDQDPADRQPAADVIRAARAAAAGTDQEVADAG